MISRRLVLNLVVLVSAFTAAPPSALSSEPARSEVLETMRVASSFMVDRVAVNRTAAEFESYVLRVAEEYHTPIEFLAATPEEKVPGLFSEK